jgi:integrase
MSFRLFHGHLHSFAFLWYVLWDENEVYHMAFNDKQARAIAAKGDILMDGVVPNLMLKSNGKSGRGMWVFRYSSPTQFDANGKSKRRDMSLGIYPITTIAQARETARDCLRQLSLDLDPLEERQKAKKTKAAAQNAKTFEMVADEYLDLQKGKWRKGSKSLAQWEASLRSYAFPVVGNKPVSKITEGDFVAILKPIWESKPETSTRLFQRCNKIMAWCRSTGLIPSNPLDLTKNLLPYRKSAKAISVHFPSLPWENVPEFVQNVLRTGPVGTCRQAMEFLILAGCRSGEVRGMVWEEVDLEQKIWTIPADRMKASKPHRIPLTPRMLEILEKQRDSGRDSKYVFPAPRDGQFSDATLSKFLKDHNVPSDAIGRFATVHGFRSSLRTWGAENEVPEGVMELMLAHTESNAVVRAYKRTDLLEERRKVMERWEAFIGTPVTI